MAPPTTPNSQPSAPTPTHDFRATEPPAAKVHVALVVVQIWFASLGVASKVVLRELPPRGLIALRASFGALFFLALWLLRGRERVALADLGRIALYGLFGIAANQLLFIEGLQRTSATNAVVLQASIPVFTVAVALLLGLERATAWKLGGLVLALAGALVVTGVWRFRAEDARALVGNLLVLGNAMCFAIYLVVSRGVLARVRPTTAIAFTFLFGALFLLPLGARGFVAAAPAIDRHTWLIVAYILAFPTVGTYLITAWSLSRAPSSLVAIYIYLQPVIGALLAACFLGERPTIAVLVGAPLIFAGIWLAGRSARAERRA